MMFGKKHESIPITVIDISSSSIGALHAIVTKSSTDSKSTVLNITRGHVLPQEHFDYNHFFETTVKELESVLDTICFNNPHKPKAIEILLSSPWFISQTRTIVHKREWAFICNQKLIDSLVEDEIKRITNSEQALFGDLGKETILIEKQISQVKLNGYTMSDPFGKKATSLEIGITITVSPKSVINRFLMVIKRHYGDADIRFTTNSLAMSVVLRDYFDKSKDVVLFDIGEKITDLGLVIDEVLLYQHSFPVGIHAFYQRLHTLGVHHGEAIALFNAYNLEALNPEKKAVVDKAVSLFLSTWDKALIDVLQSGSFGFCLPATIVVLCEDNFSNFFKKILDKNMLLKHMCAYQDLNIIFIDETLLRSKILINPVMKFDSTLVTGLLFSQRLLS